jgi:hypothetical protein
MADGLKDPGHIVRADQSSMNKKQWLVEFGCGHESWVTASRKPKRGRCPRIECNTADAFARSRRR